MPSLIACMAVCFLGSVVVEDMPEPLRRALASRSLDVARIEWLLERRTGPRLPVRHVSQFAPGGRYREIEHPSAPTAPGLPPMRTRVVETDGREWETSSDVTVTVLDKPPGAKTAADMWDPDVRRLGLTAGLDNLSDSTGLPPAAAQYSLADDAGLRRITANWKTDGGSRALVWWLDPAKDDAVVRVQSLVNGKLIREAVSEVARLDGRWFPVRVEFFRSSVAKGTEPVATVTVERAFFDQAKLPIQLNPEELLDIVNGTNILFNDQNFIWVDGAWLDLADAAERRQRGEWTAGQKYLDASRISRSRAEAFNAAGGKPEYGGRSPNPAHRPQLWEEFVRKFIKEHELDLKQSESAWRIHRDCLDRAEKYWAKRRDEIERLENERGSTDRSTRETADRKWTDLTRPIGAIFEEQLKPRLEKLLTDQQRRAASSRSRGSGSTPTTAPAKP